MPEVFKLQSPSTGKVVQIEADSPEMAFDILDEIEAGQMAGATAALGLPNAAPAVDIGKRFISGVGRALNPMNLIQAGADVAGSQLDALSQGDLTGLIPFAPMGRRMAQASADRLGEATRLAVDEGDYLGAAGQAGAAIPVVGEMAAGMGERAAEIGDYAGLAGELTGAALGPRVAGGIARRVIAPVTRVGGKVLTEVPRVGKNAFSTWLDGDAGPLKSIAREIRKEVKGAVQGPKPKRVVDDSVKEARQIARVEDKATRAELDRIRTMDRMDRKASAGDQIPEPPTVTVPGETGPRIVSPAKSSSVPQTARDVDSALKSLDKASQARLKHVVKKAMSERPAPSSIAPGRDPFKLGDRVYTVDKAAPTIKRSKIAEHYDISPDPALAPEGATGVHPTLGLPMRADGKVLVRNVEEFSDVPGRPPRGNPVWRDPDARFGNNQTINEVAEMLEARSKTTSSVSDVQKRLEDAMKKEGADIKPGSYAADEAASAARQKQHIADSYAKKEVKDAANVKQSESLIPDLEQSTELLKKYPKRGGETNSQWMQRVTKKVEENRLSPAEIEAKTGELIETVRKLSLNQGLSQAQIKAVLIQNHGIPSDHAGRAVSMILKKPKKGSN